MCQRRNFKRYIKIFLTKGKLKHFLNVWHTMKVVFRSKFKAEERYKINTLWFHFRKLEKEQIKYKVSRRKEIIRIVAEFNEIEIKTEKAK
jgi:hypothetical protein